MAKRVLATFSLLLLLLGFVVAQEHVEDSSQEHQTREAEPHDEGAAAHGGTSRNLTDVTPDYSYAFKAELIGGKMVFTGVGGDIDGVQNPTLEVEHGAVIEITLTNASVLEHDLILPELGAYSDHVLNEGDTTVFSFRADQVGEFTYYCSIAGHKEAGMLGILKIDEAA